MDRQFESLTGEEDVIALKEDQEKFFTAYPMFKLKDFLSAVSQKLLHMSLKDWEKNKDDWAIKRKKWLSEGMDCEILHVGATRWRTGKLRVKITVEFSPDEPESPLDDIRKDLNKS